MMLWSISSCKEENGPMLEQLEALEQANRADELMTNDSLTERLVKYFDSHGNANEKMRARYMLGRTYADLGELPRALDIYYEAVDYADTTTNDCDYAVLSRIYAQTAMIYSEQVQPRSQLEQLHKAEYYGKKAKDTLIAIECYSQEANAYDLLKLQDSVIIVIDNCVKLFNEINRKDRSGQVIGMELSPLIEMGLLEKARQRIEEYESLSGFFDEDRNIEKGKEVYYYIKGNYYLAVNKLDSAEYLFRKELRTGKDLNNQIAGCKGLQQVYERLKKPDSLAKYANLCYELNDSAYLLAEVENIQKFKASYNYNHNKLMAEQKAREAEHTWYALLAVAGMAVIAALAGLWAFSRYRERKERKVAEYKKSLENLEKMQSELMDICSEEGLKPEEVFARKSQEMSKLLERIGQFKPSVKKTGTTLEERLNSAKIVTRLKELAQANPCKKAGLEELRELRNLMNEEIPQFYTTLNTPRYTLSPLEYDVSLLVRVHFSPSEIQKLMGITSSYVTILRRRLLKKVFDQEGKGADYDERLLAIDNS